MTTACTKSTVNTKVFAPICEVREPPSSILLPEQTATAKRHFGKTTVQSKGRCGPEIVYGCCSHLWSSLTQENICLISKMT